MVEGNAHYGGMATEQRRYLDPRKLLMETFQVQNSRSFAAFIYFCNRAKGKTYSSHGTCRSAGHSPGSGKRIELQQVLENTCYDPGHSSSVVKPVMAKRPWACDGAGAVDLLCRKDKNCGLLNSERRFYGYY